MKMKVTQIFKSRNLRPCGCKDRTLQTAHHTSPGLLANKHKIVQIFSLLLWITSSKINFPHFALLALIESKLLNYGSSVWVGLSRQPNQGSFQWSDKSLVDYTHWAARRPSAGFGNSTCVQVGSDGRWMDVDCKSTTQAFMCKINQGRYVVFTHLFKMIFVLRYDFIKYRF